MRAQMIDLVKKNLLEVLPELEGKELSLDEAFVNLGANSIDRAELLALTLEELNSKVSRIEFVGASTINELVDLLLLKHDRRTYE